MSSEEDWATVIRVSSRLLDNPSRRSAHRTDASLAVQHLTRNVMVCGVPTEYFSDRLVNPGSPDYEEGEDAIEHLYGSYDPKVRRIDIFFTRISHDYNRFTGTLTDLLTVIRIHEYAHALVHVGIYDADIQSELSVLEGDGTTDWGSFLNHRDSAFAKIDESSHELLAQAITWACVSCRAEDRGLAETFLILQEHQSPKYKFAPTVKLRASVAQWPLVLKAARGEIDVYRGASFSLTKGLAALIVPVLHPEDENQTQAPAPEPLIEFLTRAQEAFAVADLAKERASTCPPTNDALKILLSRKGHIELRMYKEVGHHRPHFHIEYKSEYSASYDLGSLELLAGFMPQRYEAVMLPIAREKRHELFGVWQELNGPIRVAIGAESA